MYLARDEFSKGGQCGWKGAWAESRGEEYGAGVARCVMTELVVCCCGTTFPNAAGLSNKHVLSQVSGTRNRACLSWMLLPGSPRRFGAVNKTESGSDLTEGVV